MTTFTETTPTLENFWQSFALEAKCYAPGHGVGVRETSRLISRLRYRQFGVLVTTSHLDSQAYQEIREDGHPSSSSPPATSPTSSRKAGSIAP